MHALLRCIFTNFSFKAGHVIITCIISQEEACSVSRQLWTTVIADNWTKNIIQIASTEIWTHALLLIITIEPVISEAAFETTRHRSDWQWKDSIQLFKFRKLFTGHELLPEYWTATTSNLYRVFCVFSGNRGDMLIRFPLELYNLSISLGPASAAARKVSKIESDAALYDIYMNSKALDEPTLLTTATGFYNKENRKPWLNCE